MDEVRRKKTLLGLRRSLGIPAESNVGDEEDVSELARIEERHGSHPTAEKMRKGILAMLVISATVLAGMGLNQIFRFGGTTDPFTTAAVGNGRIAYVSRLCRQLRDFGWTFQSALNTASISKWSQERF